jgi:hypothetical protein
MRSPPFRRVASLIFGLSVAVTSLKLAACFVNGNPPNPHQQQDGDPPDPNGDPPDASTDADAAGEPG